MNLSLCLFAVSDVYAGNSRAPVMRAVKRDVLLCRSRLFYDHRMVDDESPSSARGKNIGPTATTTPSFCVPFTDDKIKFGSERLCGFYIQRAIAAAAATAAAVRRTRSVNWQLTSVSAVRSTVHDAPS